MRYYYQDELGSTSHIADSSGGLIESYQYDVYGKPRVYDSGGTYRPYATPQAQDLFTGQRWHSELGLYDDRNRFMSPDLGRFLQPDPIGFKGDASNLYRYCGNDWANRTDPMGLDTEVSLEYYTIGYVTQVSLHGVTVPLIPYDHENLVIRDTVTGKTLIERGYPREPYNQHGWRNALNLPQKSSDGRGNTPLRAKLVPGKNHVDPDTKKKTETVPGSKMTLKEDFNAVKKQLQQFNTVLNRANLDYQIQSVNSNAAAGTAYQNITGQAAPMLPSLYGGDLNLNRMIQSKLEEQPKDQAGDMPLKDPEGDPFSMFQSLERR